MSAPPDAAPRGGDAEEVLQRENAQLKVQLKEARAELESFTYSVSHDLRASLRHISAFTKILDEDLGPQVDPGIEGHIKVITGAAAHMTQMIDALMELSRLGRAELKVAPLELGPLIDEACATLEREIAGQASRQFVRPVRWEIADDFPAVDGDLVLVRQLLHHLLSNAIKFTRPAVPVDAVFDTRIAVGWRRNDAGQCEITIKDNGVGFDPRYHSKLFQVFSRLHSAEEFPGIGMGLALARRIVERHGGVISATPGNGGGCEVRFTLTQSPQISQT